MYLDRFDGNGKLKFKSKFMQRIIQENHEIKDKFEKEKESKQKMIEKKSSYAKYVKEIHWPEASQRKHEEL
jgi:hypothetical protein